MIDLHTHTLLSDGELLPSELVRRAEEMGYEYIAITDHVDWSNYDFVVSRIIEVARGLNEVVSVRVIPGAEVTHVPPSQIGPLVEELRRLGAKLVVVHGETLVEPVAKGTNRAAVEAKADILAHPGLISPEEVEMAAENGVYLELSSRKGHSLSNGHVATLARRYGAKLVLNTDAHSPSDLIPQRFALKVALGAGLREDEAKEVFKNARELAENKLISGERRG